MRRPGGFIFLTVALALVFCALGVALLFSGCSSPAALHGQSARAHGDPSVRAATAGAMPQTGVRSSRSTVVPRYGVFEQTFAWSSSSYANPWEQVQLTMELRSPSRRHYQVGGFYYTSNRWKARFSPSEVGRWSWQARLSDGRRSVSFRGEFRVLASKSPGFVHRSPYNRFRWSFSDGSPYYPVGIGDCVVDVERSGSPLDHWGLDGGFRPRGVHILGGFVDMYTYLRAYAAAGVNLFRWSVNNCSFPLYRTIDPGGNVYLPSASIWGDELVQRMRHYGLRVYMTIFNKPPFADSAAPAQLAAVERYVKYVVDRYGAYVDFWELMNEATASDAWYQQVGTYLRQVDPYHHPVSTSSERPDLAAIDITSPHWYEREREFDSDSDTWHRMMSWKHAGKPVIVGEQGNTGQNWDPKSALRMRLREWTAFFSEGTLIMWNASFAKDYRQSVAADIYLGPAEREYLRILNRFTQGFDPRATIATIGVSDPARVRGYALRGPAGYAAYLTAYKDHSRPTGGIRVMINPRAPGLALWISPASGKVLGHRRVHVGSQVLRVPAFTTDVALKISR